MSEFENINADPFAAPEEASVVDAETATGAAEAGAAAEPVEEAVPAEKPSASGIGKETLKGLSAKQREAIENLPTEEELREQVESQEGKWYVLNTYSGYEKKVKTGIETRIETMGMQDLIFEVDVPMERIIESRKGQMKLVERVRMPGYVLIRMHLEDEARRVVQSTEGVAGFVGNGRNPVPLSVDEVVRMRLSEIRTDVGVTVQGVKTKGAKGPVAEVIAPYKTGDSVTLTAQPWAGMPATVSEVDVANQRLTVLVTLVGKDTPVELDFTQVTKEED